MGTFLETPDAEDPTSYEACESSEPPIDSTV